MRWLLLASLFLTSCGYRFGEESAISPYRTVAIPYVECDEDGRLTNALIRAVSASGRLQYRSHGGQLCLQAKVVSTGRDNIGYQYDTNPKGERVDRLLPNEGRLIYVVEVSLVDKCRGCTLLGPFCVEESIDYPFDPLSTDTTLSVESLGQFVNIDEAERVARHPLYDRLAQKIVDYLVSAW